MTTFCCASPTYEHLCDGCRANQLLDQLNRDLEAAKGEVDWKTRLAMGQRGGASVWSAWNRWTRTEATCGRCQECGCEAFGRPQ